MPVGSGLPLALLVMACGVLCGAEPGGEERFRGSVWPLLQDSCVNCHGPEKQKGELRLDSREAMLKGGKSGPALVPGKPKESLLLRLVHHEDEDRKMPPKEELSEAQILILDKWIAQDAPWPARAAMEVVTGGERIGDAWSDPRNPIVQLFGGKRLDLWSFQPLAHPIPPPVKDVKWAANPIDAFVLAKLEAAGRKPAPEADRRTLGRRLYFDLTGLPPTPAELAAFLADESRDAYKKLVDRLLDSPAYGEHWGRMWLDVVRYGDSDGFDWDEFRPNAWRFRDYVIRSLNADKPFDCFVREQLAGDEMVAGAPRNAAEQDCLIATGYLRVGPYDNSAKKFGEYLQCRTQVMSDLVETTGAAFLGLNLSCCRCHNHKFDPVSQADYYRLRAFFEGIVPRDDLPLDLASRQEDIRRHNDETEARLAADRKQIEEITTPVAARLHEAALAALSDYDKGLLKLDYDAAPAKVRDQIRAVEKVVRTKTEELHAAFTPEEQKRRGALQDEIEALEKERINFESGLLATDDGVVPPQTHILYQGDCTQPREIVAPGVLSAWDPNPIAAPVPVRPKSSGRRTALAAWITSPENRLSARVIVNRIWQGHFGEGIQATPNDFGFSGARPSNPELLDWLAREFINQGWSMKKLHRLIVTSSTYCQALCANAAEGNTLLAGQVPRRLSAEALRDAMLSVSGAMRPAKGGPPLWPDIPDEIKKANPSLNCLEFPLKLWHPSPEGESNVRSVYLVQKRSVRVPLMETFDLPDNGQSCPRRNVTTAPPQALALMNDPFAVRMARSFAERVARECGDDLRARIDRAFALALQRPPSDDERESCLKFLSRHSLTEFCRSLLNVNEFAYVD